MSMKFGGRFDESIGGGFPVLLGIGLFNLPFGFLFLVALFVGTFGISIFWACASITNSYESERQAIAKFLNPKAFAASSNKKGGSEDRTTED
jgi:hypothetical protein